MQQLKYHTQNALLKRFVRLENKITRKSEDPVQHLHSTKSSRDSGNLHFSLTFQVSGLHSSKRTKKTLPFVRAGQLIYVFFCFFFVSSEPPQMSHEAPHTIQKPVFGSQRVTTALPEIAQSRSSCSYITTLFVTSYSVSKRHAQTTRARDVVIRISFFASRK